MLFRSGVFIVDASYTILRRAYQREKIYEAHSRHAYQCAGRYLKSHLHVTLSVIAINLCWLTPIAILVGLNHLNGVLGLIVAYVPLLVLAIKLGAGRKRL